MLLSSLKIGPAHVSIGWVSADSPPLNRRGDISEFSGNSKSRLKRYLGSCTSRYRFFGTLTYGAEYPCSGDQVKVHMDTFFRRFLRRMQAEERPGRPASLCWFLEFQKRGAPHIHFFYTHRVPWRESARSWADIVGDTRLYRTATRFEKLRAGRRGTVSYAQKYAAKLDQKAVPSDFKHVGRFWGVRGCRHVLAASMRTATTSEEAFRPREILRACERLVEQGEMRRFPWAFGTGFVYVAAKGFLLPWWFIDGALKLLSESDVWEATVSPGWDQYLEEMEDAGRDA